MRHRHHDHERSAGLAEMPAGAGTTSEIRRLVRRLVATPAPGVGTGDTVARWRILFDWARRHDVGIARLAEAHVDARAILTEAGETPSPGDDLWGVWASSGAGSRPLLSASGNTITGTVHFCSGVGIVDRALVAVEDPSGAQHLAETRMRDAAGARPVTITSSLDPWETPALRSTRTGTVHYREHPVEQIVGPPGWYLHRPGFWHGAVGPSACWAGAAAAFLDDIDEEDDLDPHRLVARGAMRAELLMTSAVLDHAGQATDRYPYDT